MGTLAEAAIIWNIAGLAGEGGYAAPLILLYRHPWEKVMTTISDLLNLSPAIRSQLRYVDSAEEAMEVIRSDHDKHAPHSGRESGEGAGAC